MTDRIHSAFEGLQHSLRGIEEHLAWIALFESERDRDSSLSWNLLSHSEDDLRSEAGWFSHEFFQTKDILAKESERTRKKWERPLEEIWKRYQRLNALHPCVP